ncbi:MAG TPA: hemolysin family protein [Gemmatimonadales bacterium]|nr:hemolysin family protein [Gemmatimonadales bacterium]
MSGLGWRLLAVVVLVAANAFFVAAEFALVASRRTRIDAMVRRGDRRAKAVKHTLQHLDRYISGTQLGITLASLGLGWIGKPALAGTLESLFAGLPAPLNVIATESVAVATAFAIITVLHIVLGELAPKALALLHPEKTSRWVAQPLIIFTIATNPFIWILNGTANAVLRLFGARAPTEHERVHSPEELKMLVEQSRKTGGLGAADARMLEGVFEFSEKNAREVMTPRTEIVALPAGASLAEAADRVAAAGRSRYPVTGESLDDVVGIVHAKEILRGLLTGSEAPVQEIARPAFFVPGTREVEDVLADMKRQKVHLAIVLDEFGGTAGLVTMEDLLEEIVGPIYDEYDQAPAASPAAASAAGPGVPILPGGTEISEVNRLLKLHLDDDDYTTIGGLLFGRLGRLPKVGDRVNLQGATFEILEMDGRRVGRVRVWPSTGEQVPEPTS